MNDTSIVTLDARRLLCPMPVIRVQKKLKELAVGDLLEVTCTDPGTLQDIPAWCRMHGHTLMHSKEIDNEIIITIKKG